MKKPGIHLIITVLLLIGIAVCEIIPSPYREYAACFAPVLFAVILGCVISGPLCGITVAAAAPVILWLMQKEASPFLPEIAAEMAVYIATALVTAIVYIRFRSAAASVLVGLLVSRAALGLDMQVLAALEKRTLTISTYFSEAYISVWRGLLLTLIAVPLICLLMKKTGAMRALRHEPKPKEKFE